MTAGPRLPEAWVPTTSSPDDSKMSSSSDLGAKCARRPPYFDIRIKGIVHVTKQDVPVGFNAVLFDFDIVADGRELKSAMYKDKDVRSVGNFPYLLSHSSNSQKQSERLSSEGLPCPWAPLRSTKLTRGLEHVSLSEWRLTSVTQGFSFGRAST